MKHSETVNKKVRENTTVTTKDYFDLLFWRCSKQSCSSCNGTKIQQLTSRFFMYFYNKIARNPKVLSHCPIMNWVTSDQHSPMKKKCQFSTIPRPCRPDTQFYIHDIVQVSGYHKPQQWHWREPNPTHHSSPPRSLGTSLQALQKGIVDCDLALSGNVVSTIHCLIILIYIYISYSCSKMFYIFTCDSEWGIPRVYPILASTPFSHSFGGKKHGRHSLQL